MDQNIGRTDLLPSTIPGGVLILLAAVAVVGWILLHRFMRSRRDTMKLQVRYAAVAPVGVLACWLLFQAAARVLFLSSTWPLWLAAALCGMTLEGVALLYEHECGIVSKRMARTLVALRLGAIGLTFFILLQPVLVTNRHRPVRRRVVVLADASASMLRPDTQWSLPEMLDVAEGRGALQTSERPLRLRMDALEPLRKSVAYWRQMAAAPETADMDVSELRASLAALREWATGVQTELDGLRKAAAPANPDSRRPQRELFERLLRLTRDAVLGNVAKTEKELDAKRPHAAQLGALGDSLDSLGEVLGKAADAADELLWEGFDEARQAQIRSLAEVPRAEIQKAILLGSDGAPSLLAKLRSRYDLDFFRFGSDVQRVADFAQQSATNAVKDAAPAAAAEDAAAAPSESPQGEAGTASDDDFAASLADFASPSAVPTNAPGAQRQTATATFRAATDITKALEETMASVPGEELAGILLLSDGRHTGEAGTDAVARRLGQARIPVSTVVIGGTIPPFDISLAAARAPEAVFLGDKVRISATVAATGARGQETRLRLLCGDEVIAEQILRIDSDDWVHEARLSDLPEEKGMRRYTVEVEPVEDELLSENNSWNLDVSVTDDRTNVLLVDQVPRWEFRYLRNLFYGRDKSVHLQYYLVEPDEIAGAPKPDLPPASASREFGDAEAGSLPLGREEWRKFDVIILGDLDEETLTPDVVDNIRHCVEDRGALMVSIAGPRNNPYSIRNERFREMLPIVVAPRAGDWRTPPEESYRFSLTAGGRAHSILKMSASVSENEQIWDDMPDFHWRIPVQGVKPGAEVLAYAAPADRNLAAEASRAVAAGGADEVLRRLAEMREQEARNSLVVIQNFGQGKVMALNFDRSWRFRYRVGDTHHHRFWGQVMRWGIGEKLAAGNNYVRIGTDRLSYTPSEPIRVLARLSDTTFTPITDAKPTAVLSSSDGKEIGRVALEYRPDSNGVYEGLVDPIEDAGSYVLTLDCPEAERRLGADWPDNLAADFIVLTARRPAEFVNITADWRLPRSIASLTGGMAVSPARTSKLWESFGEGSRDLVERVEFSLWDSWIYFVILAGLLTAEWLLRKKGGIA